MASMGCALNACTLPGEPINTRLMNSKTMEFGLGIHGEPGTEIQPVLSADDSVDKLMHAITGPPNCYLLLDVRSSYRIRGGFLLFPLPSLPYHCYLPYQEAPVVIFYIDESVLCFLHYF